MNGFMIKIALVTDIHHYFKPSYKAITAEPINPFFPSMLKPFEFVKDDQIKVLITTTK
jgi:hypothetical protein